MKLLRRLCRCAGLFCWFSAAGIYTMIVNPRRGWAGRRRAAEIARVWAAVSARIAGLRIRVHGDPAAFSGGLVVGNHQGYLDIPVHASVFPLRFAPKAEMRRWPFLGWIVGLSRPVWIDRSSRQKSREVAEEIAETLRQRISMVVYPEGTSSDGEHGLLPFKSTPFEAAVDAGAPILPVITLFRCEGEDPGGPLAWFGDAELLPHVWRILGLRRIEADLYLLDPVTPHPGEGRKELADRVREKMNEAYWRIRNGEETPLVERHSRSVGDAV